VAERVERGELFLGGRVPCQPGGRVQSDGSFAGR
jgi:hypothetical protein